MDCTLGVLAHVDAGKTTLSEQLLLHGGALRAAGRVDQGTAALDFDPVERERGVTVYTAQADFIWGGVNFHLLDTPGHTDFAAEMERALGVLDLAVLVVSAAEGVQGHTETIWERLAALKVPTVIFINKTDRAGADVSAVREQLARLSPDCVPLTQEAAAERDEAFLEEYLAGGTEGYVRAVRRLVRRRLLFPVFCGAALNDDGVTALLDGLALIGGPDFDPFAGPGAQVYQIRRDKNGVRWALCKVTSGTLRPRMALGEEKLGELRRFRGGRTENVSEAPAGTLCAVSGLSVRAGEGLGAAQALPQGVLMPLMAADLRCSDQTAARAAALTLADEEPSLAVQAEGDQITLRIMGKVQLEILERAFADRFGLTVTFGPARVLYRETIAASVDGIGHFEPLRHYAEVHVRLDPLPRGNGIQFASACPTDALARNWQRLIETHVFEREHRGVLTGAPLADVRVVLTAGRAHEKHTEGGDFRQATYRAIRQGLMKAQSILLEPRARLTARVSADQAGRLLADLQRMHAETEAPESLPEGLRVRALVPVQALGDYAAAFAAYTRGRGMLSVTPGDWVPCHNPAQVIEAAAYDPEADLEHTPDSVFCSHGAGYPVKWHAADAAAHIQLK